MYETEYAFPFDAELQGGEYDRTYIADDFARYFRAFISSGIISDGKDPGTNLQLIANGDMTTTLKAGNIIIDGYRYELKEDLVFTHSAADGVLNRIDRMAITLDVAGREITANIRESNMSYDPIAPECRRNSEYKDYIVADVYIAANESGITQTVITDTRLNTAICGIAVPFVNVDTTETFIQLQALYEEAVADNEAWKQQEQEAFTAWFETIKGQLSEDAAGSLQNQVNELEMSVEDAETSIANLENTITAMGSNIIVTVPAVNWNKNISHYACEQTVPIAGMTDETKVYVYPTHDGILTVDEMDEYDATYTLIDVYAESVDGGLKLRCVKEVPKRDIKILIEGIGG